MQVEKSLCGEYLNVQMKLREGELLYSFLEYHLRNDLNEEFITKEEYEFTEKLAEEIGSYLEEVYFVTGGGS